jgi:hypothetical protein
MPGDLPAPDALNVFGAGALVGMLICYAFEARSRHWLLGMALCCVVAAAYCLLRGVWPFVLLELVCGFSAVARWIRTRP